MTTNIAELIENLKAVDERLGHRGDILSIETFSQTWGSTALGFGGWGGQAITTANTTVIVWATASGPYSSDRSSPTSSRTLRKNSTKIC